MTKRLKLTVLIVLLLATVAAGLLIWRRTRPHGISQQLLLRVEQALQANQTQQAIDLANQCVADNPNSWQAYCALGRSLLRAGRVEEARTAMERSRQLGPNQTAVLISLAETYSLPAQTTSLPREVAGQIAALQKCVDAFSKACEILSAIRDNDLKMRLDARQQLGLTQARLAEAKRMLSQRLIFSGPASGPAATAPAQRGIELAEESKKDHEQAAAILLDVVQNDPSREAAAVTLVQAATACRSRELLQQAAKAIYAASPPLSVPACMVAMRLMQVQLSATDDPAARRQVIQSSADTLDTLIKQNGQNLYVLTTRTQLAMELNDLDGADRLCLDMLRINPQNGQAMMLQAGILLARGNAIGAEKKLADLIAQLPNSAEAHWAYVQAALAAGKRQEALESLRKVCQLDPSNDVARRTLIEMLDREALTAQALEEALTYFREHPAEPAALQVAVTLAKKTGKTELALELLSAADAARSSSPAMLLAIVEGYIMIDQAPKAIELVKAVAAMKPAALADRLALARAMILTGLYDQAGAILDEELRKNPSLAAAQFEMGNLLVRTNRLSQAAAHYAQACQIDRKNPHYALAWAQSLLESGNLSACQGVLTSLDPSNPALTTIKARLNSVRPAGDSDALAATPGATGLGQAATFLTRGQPKRCIELCQEELKKAPNNIEAIGLLADAYVMTGQTAEGLAQLGALLKLAPDHVFTYFRLAQVLSQDASVEQVRSKLLETPSAKAPLVELATAWLYSRYQQYLLSAQAARRLAEKAGTDADLRDRAYLLCAESFASAERPAEALDALKKVDPNSSWRDDAIVQKTRIIVASGQKDQAEPALAELVEAGKREKNATFLAHAIELYVSIKGTAKALAACDAMRNIVGDDVRVHVIRAEVLAGADKTDEAVAQYRVAVAKDPRNVQTQLSLARALDRQQRPGEALAVLDKLAALGASAALVAIQERASLMARWGLPQQVLDCLQQPQAAPLADYPQVQFMIGQAAARLGRTDQARDVLQKISPYAGQFVSARAELADMQKDLPGKLQALAALEQGRPLTPAALACKMRVLMQAGKSIEAADAYRSTGKGRCLDLVLGELAFQAMIDANQLAQARELADGLSRQSGMALWWRRAMLMATQAPGATSPGESPLSPARQVIDDVLELLPPASASAASADVIRPGQGGRLGDVIKSLDASVQRLAEYRVLLSLMSRNISQASADVEASRQALGPMADIAAAAVADAKADTAKAAEDAARLIEASLAADLGLGDLSQRWAMDLLRRRGQCLWAAALATRFHTDANTCKTALDLMGSSPSWLADHLKAIMLIEQNQFAQAIAMLRTSVDRYRGQMRLQMDLATALERTDRQNEAFDLYWKYWQVTSDPVAANNAAYLATMIWPDDNTWLSQATKMSDSAVDASPTVAAYRDTRGLVLLKRKQYADAAADLWKAVVGMPDSPEVHYHVGLVESALGHKDLARWHLQAALELATRQKADGKLPPQSGAILQHIQTALDELSPKGQ